MGVERLSTRDSPLTKHNGLWDMVIIFHLVLIQLGSLQASTGYPLNFNNPRVVDDLID